MRLQLAINVSDLDESIDFYRRLFATEPLKVKSGYANFAIANPPLKLVLFENGGTPGSINHLGVETETTGEVMDAEQRLSGEGLATTGVDETMCCYAEKTETWVMGPDALRWEYYVKNADIDENINTSRGLEDLDPELAGATTNDAGDPSGCCS